MTNLKDTLNLFFLAIVIICWFAFAIGAAYAEEAKVRVTWEHPETFSDGSPLNPEMQLTGYILKYSVDDGEEVAKELDVIEDVVVTLDLVPRIETYKFKAVVAAVAAGNIQGTFSDQVSEDVKVTYKEKPSKPSNLTIDLVQCDRENVRCNIKLEVEIIPTLP